MTKFQRTAIVASLGIIGFVVVVGYAGDIDWCEQVILRMSQEEYDSVRTLLTEQNNGHEPSERDIAHWWDEHHHEVP